METINQGKRISLTFFKFQGRQIPVYAYSRLYTPAHNGDAHNHDFPQIWYCLSGKYCHWVEDRKYECDKGSVVVIPPGVFHYFRVADEAGAEIVALHMGCGLLLNTPPDQYLNTTANLFLPAFSKELGRPFASVLMLSPNSQAAIEDLLSWFCLLSYAPQGTVEEREVCQKLEQIFSLPEFALEDKYRKKAISIVQSRLRPVLRILAYLNIHYPEKIEEEKLLQEGGISRAVLYRYFKRITGYTYSQYLQQVRVWRAYIYLKFTNYSLSHIVDVCGFYDTQHMLKVFTKYVGESPKERRLKLKKYLEENPAGWANGQIMLRTDKAE